MSSSSAAANSRYRRRQQGGGGGGGGGTGLSMSSGYGNYPQQQQGGLATAAAPRAAALGGGGAAAPAQPFATTVQQQQPAEQEDWFSGGGGGAPAPAAPAAASSSYYGNSTRQQPPAPAPAPMDPFGYSSGGGLGQPNQPQQQRQSNNSSSGTATYSGGMFDPSLSGPMGGGGGGGVRAVPAPPRSITERTPLLEELGINVGHIATKSRAVVLPFSRYASTHLDRSVMEDADLAGPLVFALALGGELLLSGKVSFGYIYGFGLFGCVALSLVLNLMSPTEAISVWTVTSILGYSLLPVNALAGMNVLLRISRLGVIGMILAATVIVWCTVSSTRLFEMGCGLRDQRYLVAYPVALIYSAFVIITNFDEFGSGFRLAVVEQRKQKSGSAGQGAFSGMSSEDASTSANGF
eukprot:CAMPEP_0178584220 /NCGR_PEP_ID=MMETSP0697-20121206/24704_1 /TAXON_ID=265572 /ORGANISM="Extubocellulus spinifer, Strain CCMP396" /LENGTH=407 /DNA_ID=CAMNT_0020220129 /DNA_START=39 /DNA_END=1264 /DNA_ORIENTATION=-